MKIICTDFHARPAPDGKFEIDVMDAQPADLLPRCIPHAEAAERLGVSTRHLEELAKKHGIRRLPDLPVRWRETDLLKLTEPTPATFNILPLPKPATATATAESCRAVGHEPSLQKSTTTESVAGQPKPKTRLKL